MIRPRVGIDKSYRLVYNINVVKRKEKKEMTDKEYKAMQEWLSKKLKDTPYYFSAKEEQG